MSSSLLAMASARDLGADLLCRSRGRATGRRRAAPATGETEQTIRECKGLLAKDPRSAPAHMLLAMAYIAKGSTAMVADAKAEFQQALDIDPQLLWARFYLARLYVDQGLSEKAQEQLEIGLKQSPGLPYFSFAAG